MRKAAFVNSKFVKENYNIVLSEVRMRQIVLIFFVMRIDFDVK